MQLLLPITDDPIYCPPLAGSQPATLQINVLAAEAEDTLLALFKHIFLSPRCCQRNGATLSGISNENIKGNMEGCKPLIQMQDSSNGSMENYVR